MTGSQWKVLPLPKVPVLDSKRKVFQVKYQKITFVTLSVSFNLTCEEILVSKLLWARSYWKSYFFKEITIFQKPKMLGPWFYHISYPMVRSLCLRSFKCWNCCKRQLERFKYLSFLDGMVNLKLIFQKLQEIWRWIFATI